MARAPTGEEAMTTETFNRSNMLAALGLRRTRPRSYEEWKALREWGRLPPWEPLRAGFVLRAAREAAGCTQAELAVRLGVSQQAVARAERAGSNPTTDLLEAWSRALGARLRLEISP